MNSLRYHPISNEESLDGVNPACAMTHTHCDDVPFVHFGIDYWDGGQALPVVWGLVQLGEHL